MASTESPGVAATMKADKANRESLAKKKSAVKADLQRVTAELEEVEQMKADAEDLEDEELLAEMLSEEQRLQGLKQQYTAELASIQEASQAAAQALRQRFRRITADRALGASGKSTSSESSQPATPVSAVPTPSPSEENPSMSAPVSATTTAGTAPFGASFNSSSASTATPNDAQLPANPSSYAAPSTMSNLPLSASWGASPAPAQMSMPAQHSQQSYGDYTQQSEPQLGQQEPQYRSFESSESFVPQPRYSTQTQARSTAGNADASDIADSADSSAYHPAADRAEYSQNNYPTNNSTSAYMPSTHAQDVHEEGSSLDVRPSAALEQEAEANNNNTFVHALNQELPGESTPSSFRGQSDLASKPPRPASSFATQQGVAKAGTYGQPLGGGLHDRTSSKASMMSAGSGYQADSDSNSDVQLEPQTGSQQAAVSSGVPQHESADTAPPPESSAAEAEADREAEAEEESDAKSGTSTSLLGKLGNTVWGAVEAITGHPTDSTAAEKDKTTAEDDQQLQAEPLAKASRQESQPQTGTAAEEEAAGEAQLTQTDSGYEAGEEGPVQAGPEGTSQHGPGQETEQSTVGMGSVPSGFGTSFTDAQTQPSSHWTSYAEPQLAPESAAESGAQSSFQEPLHVQTDAASSKRGAGDDQPGSASKRARGGSAVAGLVNTFDSPRSEARSPALGRNVSGSAATGTYFNTPQDVGAGFTQGTSPTKGRATSSSPFSANTTFRGPQSESLGSAMGSGALPEEESYPQSTRASQGSLDTNRDNLGSVSSIGGQAELNNELKVASQTRGLSGALPESAANLAQAGIGTAGSTGAGYDTAGGSLASITAVGSEAVPVVAAPLTNAPPSANWGSATSYAPTITPPTVVDPRQEYGSSVSEPHQGFHGAFSQADTAQHDFTSGSQGLSAQQGYEPKLSSQSVNTAQEAPTRQDSEFSSFEPSSAYTAQATGPATVASQRETVVPSTYTAEGTDRDTAAASEYNTAVPTAYLTQESTLGAPTSETQYGQGVDAFAQSQPEATSTFSAQGPTATGMAQDTSDGFGDDAFAQFSPFGQKAKQQVSPFGQQAEAQPRAQAGFDGQEVPFESSAGQAAAGNSQMTEPVPQGIKEQVTPTSVTGTFTERSPFQSTRPSDLSAQRLDSQASLGGSSYNEFGSGTGKAGSPRRRPPPPPTGAPSFGRTTSGLPLSPTQGSLQRLPSDAFAEAPSQSGAPFTEPVYISTGLASQPPISTGAQTQVPPSTGVSTVPVTAGRMSVMPTGAGTMIQGGEVVPVPPPVNSPVTQAQGADSGLLVGKTAFDNAPEPVPGPLARPGVAQGSAFSNATAAGPGPAFDTPKAGAAVMSEPLASWTSFEDPGPLPPMPAPTPDDDPSDEDIFALPVTTPATATPAATAAVPAQPAKPAAAATSTPASQASKQRSNDPWATPIEPPPEVKAAENELLSATLAGLGGDAWGNSFGPEMGRPLKETGVAPEPMAAAAPVQQEPAAAKPQAEPLMSQPSWMQMANSSNPFASFLPADTSASEPNPWATSAPPPAAPTQQAFPSQPMGSSGMPSQPMGSTAPQPGQQQAPQQASFGAWDSFNSAAPVAYPAVDNNRHPDVVPLSGMGAGPTAKPQQQQYPSPPSGPGAQQAAPAFGQDWAAFGPSGQAPQQPTGDLWTMDAFAKPQQQQQPRAAIVDSWASFDAPSEQGALGAPMASQQASQGISNINSQDSWSAFDPGHNTSARSGSAAAGFPTQSSAPSSASSQQAQQGQASNGYGGYGGVQPPSPDRETFIEEIPVQAMGLDPSLTITAKPKEGMPPSQGQYDYPQQAAGRSEGYGSQSQGSQPLPKPKRGSSAQFGSVFSPGSANSVSKLTNMFKKDKKGTEAPVSDPYTLGHDSGLPPAPNTGSGGGGGASLPPTPRGRTPRGAPPKGQGGFSEVDLWRPQSAEERQQCMNAFDQKGFGRLGGLGEVDARALWTRQNMPADMFHQVWSLSDMDNNQLLSKPEFCLFMYLMHAIRNFGTSFRLPDQISPNQAARILGLEPMVRPGAPGGPAAGGRDQAVSSTQGYSPNAANGGAGSLQGPQQYRQQGPQQAAPQDWEATGGLSPSQQQAVQELTDLGFDPRQSQDALEAHTWNRNAAANWLLQGGSNQPQGPALRRSTTDRSSNAPSLGSGGGSGFGSQSMRSSGGSGVGRYSHGHNSSAGSAADWGSGNYSPTSAGGMSQPGSARTTGDSVSGADFGTPRSRGSRTPATGNARLSLTVRKAKMDYKGIMEKPFFTLSVRARGGTLLEQSQDTPPGAFSRGIMISDQTLVLATPISELPQGAVLFFELKHWKPKEKKFSLRGWALVAVSSLVDYSGSVPQLQTGTMKLSMLQKPVDLALSRKHRRLSPEGFDLEVNVNMA